MGGDEFNVSSAADDRYVDGSGGLGSSNAAAYTVTFEAGQGHALKSASASKQVAGVGGKGTVTFSP